MNTMQQEFDAVVAHLYKQGRPAIENGNCLYRAAEGTLSCAVGCRIPDAMYSDSMEAKNVDLLLNEQENLSYELPEEIPAYKDMFLQLQKAHDSWRQNSTGDYELHHLDKILPLVANEFSLTFTRPEA